MLRSIRPLSAICLFVLSQLGAPAQAQSSRAGDVLVLYDTTGPQAHLGELYALALSALVSHFGPSRALPVQRYQSGDAGRARALVYVGSTYDEPLPPAFLADVQAGQTPVLWIADNIWQLAAADASFAAHYGFTPAEYSSARWTKVLYKGEHLDRDPENANLLRLTQLAPDTARVLAWAEAESGRQQPWAVTARNLTYVVENPLAYLGAADRYLALCDLLFDVLGEPAVERHRALVRIEDVHPNSSPETLRALADYFAGASVPFSIALIPFYTDPLGAHASGVPSQRALHEAPEVVEAIKYMLAHGGTLVLHGSTHQHGTTKNPYSGASVDDFEFFRAHVDQANNVVWDGPVEEDSAQWAGQRVDQALAEVERAGLPKPAVFEYPHYGGSVVDSYEIAKRFNTVYQRSSFYAGMLSGGAIDYAHSISVTYPFAVKEVYGWKVVPENLGNYQPVGYNNNSQIGAPDLVRAARLQRVVRDGVASFFFHPTYDLAVLREIVEGIRALGYDFVPASAL